MANIEKYLPYKFEEIEEFKNLCLAENPEFDGMEKVRQKWLNNKFPTEADLDGIKLYEKILELKPNPDDSIEDRRFRVLSKLNERLPYTWIQLHRLLAAICGWDGYELKLEDFILTVFLALDSRSKTKAVMDMLRDVLPMNIFIDVEQALEAHNRFDIYSHNIHNLSVTIVPYQKLEEEFYVDSLLVSAVQAVLSIQVLPR